jgi:ferredoxin/flavodoxin---NADP+ reductase
MYNESIQQRGVIMYPITQKTILTPSVSQLDIHAPLVIRHAKPGQFVMLRVTQDGERIPLTIAGINHITESVSVIFQVVGATTFELNQLNVGDHIHDIAGPLGKPTELSGLKKVCIIGGGVGCAIAYPIAKALSEQDTEVHTIIGFRNKSFIFLESEFSNISTTFHLLTDDGSSHVKGRVTDQLKIMLDQGFEFDEVIAIGPLLMMKSVSELTKKYGIKTVVSMNPIMVDGTGMCGGCRVSVAGQMKFACVDGPEFDGHQVDFDAAILRNKMYQQEELENYQCEIKKAGETL